MHPGGHFLPSSQKQYVAALVGFIKEAMGWDEEPKAAEVEGKKKKTDGDFDDFPF